MRLKSELYAQEQEQLSNKIIDILELDEESSITLYELDHDLEKQEKIMKMSEELKKYFTYAKIEGLKNPEKCQRPWLSIIRQITKPYHTLYSADFRLVDNKKIRTTKYLFLKKKIASQT